MEKRKSFLFYADWLEVIRDLSIDERGILFTLIAEYILEIRVSEIKNCPLIVKSLFRIIKAQLDRDNEKYEKKKTRKMNSQILPNDDIIIEPKLTKYEEFLQSDYWKEVRKMKLEKCPVCEICGNANKLQVHHKNYDHVKNEKGHLDDLQVLCKKCHENIHGIKDIINQ